MYDYRNNLKRILQSTSGDDNSLRNSLAAIKSIIDMTDNGVESSSVKKVTQIDSNLVNNLLSAITLLINEPGNSQAKKSAIRSIHQLTFEPGIGKKYGQQLGKLDIAIQNSTETSTVKEAKIFKKAVSKSSKPIKKDTRHGQNYTVIRLLSGADLINDNGETVYTVTESQVHPLNLKSGDIVEAVKSANPTYEADILRVNGYRKLRKRDFDQIDEFKYAVVQKYAGTYSISRNVKADKLKINNKPVTISVDPGFYQGDGQSNRITDGSIVDLAWYQGDIRLKKNPSDAVKIRWVYQTEQAEKSVNKKKAKKKTDNQDQTLSYLDFDLHYQRVGIAVGDNQNEAMLESIVTKYNGIPIAIDAFEGKKKVIENQIKDLDLVILVTAYAAHDSTWNIREFVAKYGVKFAVSSSKGYQSFERALYRAVEGLPAYEGNQSINYRYKD